MYSNKSFAPNPEQSDSKKIPVEAISIWAHGLSSSTNLSRKAAAVEDPPIGVAPRFEISAPNLPAMLSLCSSFKGNCQTGSKEASAAYFKPLIMLSSVEKNPAVVVPREIAHAPVRVAI